MQCPRGTVQIGSECAQCPKNQYQDQFGQMDGCKICPQGTETLVYGSRSSTACIGENSLHKMIDFTILDFF